MEEICRDYLATIPFPFSRWASIASSVPSKNCTRESVFEGAPFKKGEQVEVQQKLPLSTYLCPSNL